MKRIAVIFLAVIINLSAQDIEKQILEYSDSDQEIISKSRKLILDKITERDLSKVREIVSYLDEKFDRDRYVYLWETERCLIDYWTEDYADIIETALSYYESDTDYSNILLPPRDLLWNRLREVSAANYDSLKNKIDYSGFDEERKFFLHLFLDKLLADENSQDTINKSADEFLNYYNHSVFEPFVRNYIRYVYVPSSWGFGIEFFTGYGGFNGNLKNLINDNVPFGLAVDMQYKELMAWFRLYMGFAEVRQDFSYNGTWKKALPLEITAPEISIGYPVFDGSLLKVSPFAGIVWMEIAPPEEDAAIEGNNVTTGFSTGFTYGLNCDIKFSRNTIGDGSGLETGYWYIRLRLGYTDPSFEIKYNAFSGNMFYLNIGVGGFGRAVVREF